jgi:NAD(P)-dependent dehydrogenase (short-subunit alcohol dehydrogenase family)
MAQDNGKVCVVTGALGSIGAAITTQLAQQGNTVVMVVRDEGKAKAARDAVAKAAGHERVETLACDFADTKSIRAAAQELKKRHPKIDVLVNNAAAFSATRKTTADGFEMQMGVNHLGHFLFTRLLEEPLKASGKGRVVVMGMPAKKMILDDLMLEKKYDGMTAYEMSKSACLYFTRELAERWKGQVAVNAVHPGLVKTTLISEAPLPIRLVFKLFAATAEKGAETPVFAATSPEIDGVTGKFFVKRKDTPFPPGSENAEARKKLWEMSEKFVGLA